MVQYLIKTMGAKIKARLFELIEEGKVQAAITSVCAYFGIPKVVGSAVIMGIVAVHKARKRKSGKLSKQPTRVMAGQRRTIKRPKPPRVPPLRVDDLLPKINRLGMLTGEPHEAEPAAYGSNFVYHPPEVTTSEEGGVHQTRVRGKAYIEKIVGATSAYTAYIFSIHPTSYIFNRLNKMASAFSQWRLNDLKFSFYTEVGTDSAGSILMAYLVDSHAEVPENERDLLSNVNAQIQPIWKPVDGYSVTDAQPNQPVRYVRLGPVPEGADQNNYDAGHFILAFTDLDSSLNGVAIGRLIMEYDITLTVAYDDEREEAIYNTLMGNDTSAVIGDIFSGSTVKGELPIDYTSTPNCLSFSQPGFYLVSITLGGTSPGITNNGGGTVNRVEQEMSDQIGSSPEGICTIWSYDVTEPGQCALYTVSGAVTECIWTVTRRTTALQPTHTLPSASDRYVVRDGVVISKPQEGSDDGRDHPGSYIDVKAMARQLDVYRG